MSRIALYATIFVLTSVIVILKRRARVPTVKIIQALCEPRKRIILVGNGPSIRRKRLGSLIDAFDIVVRFNSYQLIPEYTGTRTTLHMVNELSDIGQGIKTVHGIRVVVPGRIAYTGSIVSNVGLTVPYHVVRKAKTYLASASSYPSSGLITTVLFTSHISQHVAMVGFDGNLKSSKNKHYYANQEDSTIVWDSFPNHEDERMAFRTLLREGTIFRLRTKQIMDP